MLWARLSCVGDIGWTGMGAYRKDKLARLVLKIVSETVAQRLNDPRVSPLTTVTRVEMADDLSVAKVYLSLPGEESVERLSLNGVRSAAGFIQRILAGELTLRQCPALHFDIDERVRKVRETMDLLAENRRNDPTLESPTASESGEDGVDDDWSPVEDGGDG